MLDIKESQVNELKKFRKEELNIENTLTTASELKYANEIKLLMNRILTNPSDDFISYVLSEIYTGRKTQNVVEKFKPLIIRSINQFITELMNDRIKSALEQQSEEKKEPEVDSPTPSAKDQEEQSKIVTTMEELEAFFIIKSVLREVVPIEKITYKDTQSYFGVLFDNNTWKWICPFYFKENAEYLIVPDENKKEKRIELSSINDLYNYKDLFTGIVKRYA
ncbi:MAG: hypothetical protein ACM3TR_13530 [Caulobacteraceae bacterium]